MLGLVGHLQRTAGKRSLLRRLPVNRRIERKDYVVKDGDVLHFLFNV